MAAGPLDNDGNSFDCHDALGVIPWEFCQRPTWRLPQTEHERHAGVCFSIKGSRRGRPWPDA